MTGPQSDDDELARLLRRLRGAEPDRLSSVDDVIGGVRQRVVRRQQVNRVAAGAIAVVAAVALVVVPTQLGGSDNGPGDRLLGGQTPSASIGPSGSPTPKVTKSPRNTQRPGSPGAPTGGPGGHGKQPSDDATVVPATSGYDDHGCPTTWAGPADTAWLPALAPALAGDLLLPAGPEFLAVCDYPLDSTGSRSLSGSVSVRAGFTEMVSAVGADAPAELDWCTDEEAEHVYLLRANYGNDVVWVSASAGQGCGGATNGQFTGAGSFVGQLPSVLTSKGTWGGAYPGDCAESDARAGRADQMAPTKDLVRMFICVTNNAVGQKSKARVEDLTDVNEVAGRVNVLPSSNGSQSCDPKGQQTYLVNFRYDGGEDVSVRVAPDCETGVFNGVLTAATPDNLIELLERLTRD